MRKYGKILAPVHPGEVLSEEFIKPLGLTANRLALELRVAATRISEIVKGERAITADTALRLGRYFHTSPEFWMNLQRDYDLARAEDEKLERVEREVRPR